MELNIFLIPKILDILGFLHLRSLSYGRLDKSLSCTKLAHGARSVELPLKTL